MSLNINKVLFAGRLTRDPELKALPSGQNVCSLSVASGEKYTNKDGETKETTEFADIVVFGKQAENSAKYLIKGQEVFVEGKMQTRNWEKDGVKHYRTEIIAQSVQFGSKPQGVSQTTSSSNTSSAPTMPDYPEDEINPEDVPF